MISPLSPVCVKSLGHMLQTIGDDQDGQGPSATVRDAASALTAALATASTIPEMQAHSCAREQAIRRRWAAWAEYGSPRRMVGIGRLLHKTTQPDVYLLFVNGDVEDDAVLDAAKWLPASALNTEERKMWDSTSLLLLCPEMLDPELTGDATAFTMDDTAPGGRVERVATDKTEEGDPWPPSTSPSGHLLHPAIAHALAVVPNEQHRWASSPGARRGATPSPPATACGVPLALASQADRFVRPRSSIVLRPGLSPWALSYANQLEALDCTPAPLPASYALRDRTPTCPSRRVRGRDSLSLTNKSSPSLCPPPQQALGTPVSPCAVSPLALWQHLTAFGRFVRCPPAPAMVSMGDCADRPPSTGVAPLPPPTGMPSAHTDEGSPPRVTHMRHGIPDLTAYAMARMSDTSLAERLVSRAGCDVIACALVEFTNAHLPQVLYCTFAYADGQGLARWFAEEERPQELSVESLLQFCRDHEIGSTRHFWPDGGDDRDNDSRSAGDALADDPHDGGAGLRESPSGPSPSPGAFDFSPELFPDAAAAAWRGVHRTFMTDLLIGAGGARVRLTRAAVAALCAGVPWAGSAELEGTGAETGMSARSRGSAVSETQGALEVTRATNAQSGSAAMAHTLEREPAQGRLDIGTSPADGLAAGCGLDAPSPSHTATPWPGWQEEPARRPSATKRARLSAPSDACHGPLSATATTAVHDSEFDPPRRRLRADTRKDASAAAKGTRAAMSPRLRSVESIDVVVHAAYAEHSVAYGLVQSLAQRLCEQWPELRRRRS